ncbi:hypothetical protein LOTGIDRAFT_161046 [Lottia gigantea]|uniref:Endonuclease/exonuclease/phosphatase domain-containing protein n=1 Tax=Lottia gigantea TaxID=225164 RepID=V4C046_LOTGI|nr:hypothetical protein LOTGIDRAFT_161046 [Lottia gigantea]ESO94794.1 hypothetical protein LOTGIDRAFT_161046 [Lottia gigantea]
MDTGVICMDMNSSESFMNEVMASGSNLSNQATGSTTQNGGRVRLISVKRSLEDCTGETESEDINNSSHEDILWIHVTGINSNLSLCLAVCYLPPEGSTRPCEPQTFFETLLEQIYSYQNMGDIQICGDFNARCGDASDTIDGVHDP